MLEDFSTQRAGRASDESCRFPERPRTSDRPLLAGRRRSLCHRRPKHRPRPGASVLSARRRTVADCNGQSVRCSRSRIRRPSTTICVASQRDPNTTHQPDPAKGAAFLASHPETARALAIIKSHPLSSGFDNTAYYGLNAFRFVNADGASTYVRWTLTPMQPFEAGMGTNQNKNFLFDGLIASIQQHPLQWHLVMTIAQTWRSDRRRYDPVAGRARASGRRNADARFCRKRRNQSGARHQFRSAGFASRHGAFQRSLVQRAVVRFTRNRLQGVQAKRK